MLCTEQRELEELAKQRGAERQLKAKKRAMDAGSPLQWSPTRKIVELAASSVVTYLQQDLDAAVRKRGPKQGVRELRALPIGEISIQGLALTLHGACNPVIGSKERTDAGICEAIGGLIECMTFTRQCRDDNPELVDMLERRVKKEFMSANQRRRMLQVYLRRHGYEPLDWQVAHRVNAGSHVFRAVMKTGVFISEVVHLTHNGKQIKRRCVSVSPGVEKILMQMEDHIIWSRPEIIPHVSMPQPWGPSPDGEDVGPYLSLSDPRSTKMVRTRYDEQADAVNAAIDTGQMGEVFSALNLMQTVPLRINKTAYGALKRIHDKGVKLNNTKLPNTDKIVIEEVNADTWKTMSPNERKAHRQKKEKAHLMNLAARGSTVILARELWTAEKLIDRTFYLPHYCDFRGRAYPIPMFSHQRQDYLKALIEFNAGKPVYDDYWLCVSVANHGDYNKISKQSFDDRVAWVRENEGLIREFVWDPFSFTEWWSKADHPLQFLVACTDLVNYWERGPGYVSHQPIAMDGTNSGLQHFSAILRSTEDGQRVNLLPGDKVCDVYQDVADDAIELMEQDLKLEGDSSVFAKKWLTFGVSRKLVKRNVMTFPYSSKQFGFGKQIFKDTAKPLADRHDLTGSTSPLTHEGDEGLKASFYLAGKVWKSVNTILKAAGQGMQWLGRTTSTAAAQGVIIRFTSPVGFPVVNVYKDQDNVRVSLDYEGLDVSVLDHGGDPLDDPETFEVKVRQYMWDGGDGELRRHKMANAISPNIIHSCDAAHLMRVVNASYKEGIEHFLMVHDSFATHAADIPRFREIILEQFVDMYTEHDPLEQIYEFALAAGVTGVPIPPEKGDLDLRDVLRSPYAFS